MFPGQNPDGSIMRPGDPRRGAENVNPADAGLGKPFKQSTKERVTFDLPPKYAEMDLDFDGQIAIFEWMTLKRDSLTEYDLIDLNFDGLLTPLELQEFDKSTAANVATTVKKPERLLIVGGAKSQTNGNRSNGRDAAANGSNGQPGASNDQSRNRGGGENRGENRGDRGGFSRGGGQPGEFPQGGNRGGFVESPGDGDNGENSGSRRRGGPRGG